MKRKHLLMVLAICLATLACSCESHREKKAIEICQKTKIQLSLSQEENQIDDPISLMATKLGFVLLGLDFETSTWLDMANKVAEH